jgi:hypothetical protein
MSAYHPKAVNDAQSKSFAASIYVWHFIIVIKNYKLLGIFL